MSPLIKTILTIITAFAGILITFVVYEYVNDSHFLVAFSGGAFTILIGLLVAEKDKKER